jgi:pimeloyl-ACP methyl ester carboxylesterase
MFEGSRLPSNLISAARAQFYGTPDGARLHYRDEGAGPAVLLIHGWTLDLRMWDPQVEELASSFRLVRMDRRGFGLSSGRSSLAADARDVLSLCQSLRLQRIAIVGMSQGARVALRIAALAPHMLDCLALDGPPELDTATSCTAEPDIPVAHYRELLRTQGLTALRREWSGHPMARLHSGDERAQRLLTAMLDRYEGTDLLDFAAEREDMEEPSTAGLRVPALLINGEFDLDSRKRAADNLAQSLPRAEHAVIASAGHLPNLDQPHSYNTVLRRFLERHAPAHH